MAGLEKQMKIKTSTALSYTVTIVNGRAMMRQIKEVGQISSMYYSVDR